MKLVIFSDTHCEYEANKASFLAGFDARYRDQEHTEKVCILPGDIGSLYNDKQKESLEGLLAHIAKQFAHTYFVAGNHCFYGSSISAGMRILNELDIPNFTILHPGKIAKMPDGRLILGGTGWFREGAPRWLKKQLNDFRTIHDFEPEAYEQFDLFNRLVVPNITEGSVVVSHHSPSPLSIHPDFKNEPSNWFFCVDREKTILEKQPALWCFGHVHNGFDFMIDQTRVVANPKGYQNECRNPDFWDRCEIELEHLTT